MKSWIIPEFYNNIEGQYQGYSASQWVYIYGFKASCIIHSIISIYVSNV